MGLYNLREGCIGQDIVEGGSEKGVSTRRPGDGWGSVRRGEARRAIPFLPALGNSIPRVWYMAVDVGFLLAAWKMTGPDHIHIHTHAHKHTHTHTHTHTHWKHIHKVTTVYANTAMIHQDVHTSSQKYTIAHAHIYAFWGKGRGTESLPCLSLKVGGDHCTSMHVCVKISCTSAVSAIGTLVVCLCCCCSSMCGHVCVGGCVGCVSRVWMYSFSLHVWVCLQSPTVIIYSYSFPKELELYQFLLWIWTIWYKINHSENWILKTLFTMQTHFLFTVFFRKTTSGAFITREAGNTTVWK